MYWTAEFEKQRVKEFFEMVFEKAGRSIPPSESPSIVFSLTTELEILPEPVILKPGQDGFQVMEELLKEKEVYAVVLTSPGIGVPDTPSNRRRAKTENPLTAVNLMMYMWKSLLSSHSARFMYDQETDTYGPLIWVENEPVLRHEDL